MSATDSLSAVGLAQGTFQVDANGQATYKLPVDLPPGIANLQPQLSLVYSHRQPNGPLGVGWALSGQSAITRTKATYAVDGFNSAVSYGPEDRFALDGARLINVEGEQGAGGTVYYTEMQSWSRVVAGATPQDGFTVYGKAGEVRAYGTTANSRILAPGSQNIRVWALASVTDLHGNRIEYTYTLSPDGQHADAGSYFLQQIAYTVRDDGTQANRFVRFTYEPRPDPIEDYVAGYPVNLFYRLTQISTVLGADETVRTYTLGYRTSTATQLSCLASVTLTGAKAEGAPSLPPTVLVWQDVATPGFDIGASSTLDQHLDQADIRPMDVNGDGRTDIVQLWNDGQSALHATVYLATPGAEGTPFVRASDTTLGSFPSKREIYPMDLNGDGRTDLLVVYPGGTDSELRLAAFLWNGTAFEDAGIFQTGYAWDASHLQFFAMDANGDGRTDLVQAYSHYDAATQGHQLYFRSFLSQFGDAPGAMFTQALVSPTEDPAQPTQPLAFWPMDVNGDGMVDLVRVWQSGSDQTIRATAYLGSGSSRDTVSFTSSVRSNLGTLNLSNSLAFLPVDVNGDGVLDLLQIWKTQGASSTTLHLTAFLCDAAGGFVPGPDSAFENAQLDPDNFFPMDIDGSGLTAIVNKWIGNDRLMFTVYRGSPSGSYRMMEPFDAGAAGTTVLNSKFFACDVNGDGKADLVRAGMDANQQFVLAPYTSSGAFPDMVSSFTNALGGTVTVQYAALSDASVYGPGDPLTFPAGEGSRYPNPLMPGQYPVQAVLGRATYVVSRYGQANNAPANRFAYGMTNTVTYAGAQLDLLGRGWQGFKTVTNLSLDTGLVTVDTYNQDFPYTGTKASSRVEANGAYTTDPRVPRDQTVLMNTVAEVYTAYPRATGATAPNPVVYETLRTSSRWESWSYGTFGFALAHTYGYDAYGNETLDANLGYVDDANQPLAPTEAVYQHRQYQNDLLGAGWALGYLRYAKESANANDTDITRFLPGDYHLQVRTYAPSTYDLLTQAQWDDSHGAFLTVGYGYDGFGNKRSETQPGGFTTTYDYEPDYHTYVMQTHTPPNAQGTVLVTASGYDPRFGTQVASMDANGVITLTGLDAFGRKAALQGPVPEGTQGDPNEVTPLVTGSDTLRAAFQGAATVTLQSLQYLDDGQGGLYTETQALQSFPTSNARELVWTRGYVDGRGRPRQSVRQTGQQAGNAITLTDYNPQDQPTAQSFPFFSDTLRVSSAPFSATTAYDVLGRPLQRTVPSGPEGAQSSVTQWFYGGGQAVTLTSAAGSDAEYVEVSVHRFANGKDTVVSVTVDPEGANATTQFTFDPVARLTTVKDPPTADNPDGVLTTLAYDSLDRRRWLDNPDQNTTGNASIQAMAFAYDAATGRQSGQTDAAQAATAYTYDGLGRILTKTLSDARTFTYTYDDAATGGNGRLSRVVATQEDGTVESEYAYAYDAYGNIRSNTVTIQGEQAPFAITRVFDPQQRTVLQTYPDATAQSWGFSYGQLITTSLDGARADSPLEDFSPSQKAGTLIYGQGLLPGSGVVTGYTFNPAGQVISERVQSPVAPVLGFSYTYDLLNQLRTVEDQLGTGQSQAFTYLNRRLMSASVPGFSGGAYTYDNAGNLTSKDGVVYISRAHFAATGTLDGNTVYSATPDACGRTLSRTANGVTLGFAYDGLSCLRKVTDAQGATLREMMSDHAGNLLRQVDAGGNITLFIDACYQVYRPREGTPTVTKYLTDARGTAASITNGAVLYLRRDFKGNNTHAFGPDGTVVSQVAYGGYGERRLVSGEGFQPQYEQRTFDADLGLSYFGARYYDPALGRFLTPDSQPGSDNILRPDAFNRFAFELNNPINLVDPTGHSAWSVVLGVLLAAALVIAGAAILVASGGTAVPALAAAAGAIIGGGLVGAGISAGTYSVTHLHESNTNFWKGYGVSASVGFVVGAVTGGLATVAGMGINAAADFVAPRGASWLVGKGISALSQQTLEKALSGVMRAPLWMAFGALTTSGGDVFSQFMSNVTDKKVLDHSDVSLSHGLWLAFGTGAAFGALAGAAQGIGEALLLKPKSYGAEGFSTQPQEMAVLRGENTQLLGRGEMDWYTKPNLAVQTTVRSRIVLFGVSTGASLTDAAVASMGY
ncbi:FG-GAP-like repeat-containing protein [Stigmatella erecta]|uniref:RHS repeat-associated core domain-containing protein n=1 Tax=Stigmatella erecta TaxID=83460 RepID=A0A1I0L3V2_9BACT|nr:FG-GAP-like repeat-containing protein [Stigmatella erecta]SEU34077.1 RHS repeat-associated core domain-containing protein [Stigmatella erecta]